MLGPSAAPRRVLVVGPPGAGKSWIAAKLASVYGLQHTQLDALKLRPLRQVASQEEFRAALEQVLQNGSWLLDGNWADDDEARRVWADADVVVWLDYSRRVVIAQVALRSLRRLIRREPYFGWSERIGDWFSPTHPIRWSWKMVRVYSARYALMASRVPRPSIVHLGSRGETNRYLDQLAL